MVKLKICGMRDAENILQVAAFRPDYMGFIFYEKSPRFVGDEFKIPELFPSTIKRVGVFVNELTVEILKQVERLSLDYIQLHGNETVQQCQELHDRSIKIIKVFSVDDDFDFAMTKPYRTTADFFMFDTKGKYHGGNARTFNWEILKQYDQEVPFFLSGGLTPDNIKGVVNLKDMNLHALDVNSGVELNPGLKNLDEIKRLFYILNSNS